MGCRGEGSKGTMKRLPALRSSHLALLVLWFIFNGSFTLLASALAMVAAAVAGL